MNTVVYWALNRAKEPSTWAGLAGLAVVFGVSSEQWSMIGNAVAAVSKLFGALTGLYRDSRLRRAGAK